MTRSVYVIGGAGTGKSTFMEELLTRSGVELEPLEDLHATPNAKGSLVTLRGHRFDRGVYLGVMRDQFPGSDGLDRASSITGEEWLHKHQEGLGGDGTLPERIIGEGATLATRRFLTALNLTTDLLILALRCDPMIHDLRLLARGTGQMSQFVTATVTRTENLVRDMEKELATVRWVESDDGEDWQAGLLAALVHLAA